MSNIGVNVTTNELLQAGGGIATNAGTAFFAGATDKGPATVVKCQSTNDYVTAFGPRTNTSAALYDAVDVFFQEGGSVCYVARVTDGTATSASLTLNDSGPHPTVVVTALTPGTDGNNIYIKTTVASSKVTVLVQDAAGDVLETIGPFTQPNLLAYTGSAYVAFTQSAGSGFTSLLPVAISATALSGGADANDLTAASYVTALALFTKDLGPGTVATPLQVGATVWSGLLAHAAANNRFAVLEMTDSATAATLVSALGTTGAVNTATYGMAVGSTVIAPGIAATSGVVRTGVSAAGVIAGLRAQVAATGNNNQAPAGRNWPLGYVTGFTNTFNDADTQTLNTAGINVFANRYGVPCLFGFVTLVTSATDPIFWQASASCERMALVAEGAKIMEGFLFSSLDGQNLTITAAQGALQGLVARHWRNNALFGASATDAGAVAVGSPVNTTATEQAGQLNANLQVRISPFAQAVNLSITSVPITQTL